MCVWAVKHEGQCHGANLSPAVPSQKQRTALKWCDVIGEHRSAKRKVWNAVNENRVFNTYDHQLDLAPTRRYPIAGNAGQSDELCARWRQMDGERRRT